jgi:hypothetical protein
MISNVCVSLSQDVAQLPTYVGEYKVVPYKSNGYRVDSKGNWRSLDSVFDGIRKYCY